MIRSSLRSRLNPCQESEWEASKAGALALVRLEGAMVGDQVDWAQVAVPCHLAVEAVDPHRTVSAGPSGVVLQVFPDPV
jgi:hypothetical protein